jgi:chromosomal replication initiator protein
MVCSPPPGPPRPLIARFRRTSPLRGGCSTPVPDDPLSHAWPRIRAELQRAVTEPTWHLWLEPIAAASLADGELVLEAPDEIRPWITANFSRLLQAAADAVLGAGAVSVRLLAPGAAQTAVAARAGARLPAGTPGHATAPGAAGRSFNPRLTFDQFVIGDSNRLAHAAALSVAEMPGLAYNPLFICGPPGLGKTHLLHSIANYLTEHGDGLSVLYTTVEAFTDQFVGALHTKQLDAFKAAYRTVDVLLVDDIQFLQSKAATEQEFFHTFNALQGAGAQLVLTSDRLPRDLDALEDRLRERFEAGLVCDVRPPDPGTRLTILRKRVLQDGIAGVEPAALELIAARVDTNIRALEGALIRVVAFGSLTGRPVTHELAAEVLDGLYPELRPARRTVREIQESTCEAFGISLDDLVSQSRAGRLAWPRQVAMYLARELTDQTLPAIGREFGNRGHTTVMHACKRTAERIATDREAYDAVRRLTERLGGAG